MKNRRTKQDGRKKPQEKRGSKQELRAKQQAAADKAVAEARERTKRSGVDAVKLHLQATGGTGRTSRSATAVRKTSIRMTAIKEYPFDLSDLRNQPTIGGDTQAQLPPPGPPVTSPQLAVTAPDGKRKVSIMADESSKDRENLPSERNGGVSAKAEGPSRRKSNLHNAMAADIDSSWDRQGHIEGRFKKYSTTSSVYSKKALSQHSEYIERSWWYACCQKCHQEESGIPSWEPPSWQKVCPYPLCPSYRHFAQTVSVFIIGILVWGIIWIIMGGTAAPGGQLFTLAVLTIAAYCGGWLMMKITTLPSLIGMLIVGIILKNVGFVNFDDDYQKVASYIRKIALTIILTRAGLDLDPVAMKKYFLTVIKLALVPWTFECVLCAVLAYFFLGLPWDWAFLLSSIIAAVSPAVIVPCLFRLREKGYGVSKGIPTLVLAVSGVDDAASVAVFGIVSSIMFSNSSLTMNIIQIHLTGRYTYIENIELRSSSPDQDIISKLKVLTSTPILAISIDALPVPVGKGPCSVIGGIAFGVLCGYIVKYIPERNDAFLVPLRVLLLLTGGLLSVLGSEEIGWGGAGPLAVIAFAFVAGKNWSELGWELEDNPVATAFEIFWMFFEPMLFSVTGAQVVIEELAPHLVLIGGGILIACAVLRALVTSASAVRSNLNMREKIFVGLAWMAKATVQAALGPVALDEVRKMTGVENHDALLGYAETVVTVCIMSIVITAPIGAIVITLTGPKLLSRTTKPPVLEGWRRSHRPSIRDISIIDEEEVAERDAEAEAEAPAHSPPASPAPPAAYSTPAPAPPPAPITVQPNHHS